MKYRLVLLCMVCNLALGFAQDTSRIDFVIKNLGVGVDGHFETFSIQPRFEEEQLKALSGTIAVASIKTGINARDEHLLKADYFDVENYPQIRFESEVITQKATGTYKVPLKLTLKGKTKRLSIPVTVTNTAKGTKLQATFEIDRSAFDVGGGGLILSKTVVVTVVYYDKRV